MTGKGLVAASGKQTRDPSPAARRGCFSRPWKGKPPRSPLGSPFPHSGMGARTPVIRVTPIQKPAQTMFPSTIPRKNGRRRR